MHPLERLVNLVALLLEARKPLTFDEIRERLVEGYGQSDVQTAKRMFERDKDILRDVGVPIEVVATDAWEVEQGYAIEKSAYYLPEIRFTPEEISALVVTARSAGDDWLDGAVQKLLSGAGGGILASVGHAPIGGGFDPNLARAGEAVAARRRVSFAYQTSRGERSERTVDAYGLALRGAHWYLVGLDHDRGEIRSFRLSRVSGELEDVGEGGPSPEGFRALDHIQAGPWGAGEAEVMGTVAFSPDVAWWATTGIPSAEILEPREDGWVPVRVPWQPGESLASWVLSFGPEAEAVEPPELRREVVERLEAILGA